ncbi:hypothetical protein MCOR25_000976 [Pyricularia grisea]|nr:hypothetical protein MCOR25_000976 [Pyricularia grisea]
MALVAQVISIFSISDNWARRHTVVGGEANPRGHPVRPDGSVGCVPGRLQHRWEPRPAWPSSFMFAFAYSFYFNSVVLGASG